MILERKYTVNIQPFYLTLNLISVYAIGRVVWVNSLFKAFRILLLPITAILDVLAISVVYAFKVIYIVAVAIVEITKNLIIKIFEMIIKSVIGKILAILAITATLYSIYIILTTGSWQEALTKLQELSLEFYYFFL